VRVSIHTKEKGSTNMFTDNYANQEDNNNNKRIEGDLRDMNELQVRIPTEKQINYAAVLMSQHADLSKIPADYQHTFASVFKTIDKYSKVPDPKIYEQTKERYYLIRNTFFKNVLKYHADKTTVQKPVACSTNTSNAPAMREIMAVMLYKRDPVNYAKLLHTIKACYIVTKCPVLTFTGAYNYVLKWETQA